MQRIAMALLACWCALALAGCPTPTRLAFAETDQTTGGTTQLWVHVSNDAARDAKAGTATGGGDGNGQNGQQRKTTSLESRPNTRAALANTLDGTNGDVPLLVLCLAIAVLVAARMGARRMVCAALATSLVVGLVSPARAVNAAEQEEVTTADAAQTSGEVASGDSAVAGEPPLATDDLPHEGTSANDVPAAQDAARQVVDELEVRFEAHGGSGTMESATVPLDQSTTLPACAYECTDRTMVGWDVRLDPQRLAQVAPTARASDVLRIADEAALHEGMLECALMREGEQVERMQVDARRLACDGRVTLVAVWSEADVDERGSSDDAGDQGDSQKVGDATGSREASGETPSARDGDGSSEKSGDEHPYGEDGNARTCDSIDSQNGEISQSVLDDMGISLDEDQGWDVELPTRTITLVSHAPGSEDVSVALPEGEGRVPQCPFEWDRHRFVDWTLDAGQDYRHLVPGEELPPGEVVLHAQWKKQGPLDGVEGLDFSSCRLIVGTVEEPSFGTVLSAHDGVWLLAFEDASDAAWAYVDHRGEVDFIAPDITIETAANGGDEALPLAEALLRATSVGDGTTPAKTPSGLEETEGDAMGPVADLTRIGEGQEEEHGTIALVDTGVNGNPAHVAKRLSVIDSFLYDGNGHGTSMLQTMVGVDPQARVVSIRALNNLGTGSAASVYAAIETAIQMECKAINLSLSAPAVAGNAAVEQAICDAHAAGIMVVGAAGNEGRDAKWYVPGKMGAEAVIAGSSDSEGTRDASSNFGSTVDLYVPSASTSYASAKVAAWLAAHSSFGNEMRDLQTDEARRALGLVTDVEQGDAADAPKLDESASFGVAWTHPTIHFAHHWSNIGWADNSCNGKSYLGHVFNIYGNDANFSTVNSWCGGNPSYWENSLEAIKIAINAGSSTTGSIQYMGHIQNQGTTSWVNDGVLLGATGKNQRLEAWKVALSGSIAQQYYIDYRGWTHVPNNTSLDGIKNSNTDAQGWCGIVDVGAIQTSAALCLRARSFAQLVQVRYQNPDGSWGGYSDVVNGNYTTGSDVTWSRAQDDTYVGSSVSYTVTAANAKQVSVARRTATNTIKVRYQHTDGSWGEYSNASSGTDCVGAVRKWSHPQDATYKAASASIACTASPQTKYVDVERHTYAVAFKGNGSTSGSMGKQTLYVGQRMTLAPNAFARRGHSFTGWNTTAGGTGESYANKAIVKDLTVADGTVTLFAQWRAHTYTVSLNANASDAQGQMTPIAATYGEKFRLPACGFTRRLFSFVAWNTKADGSGTWYRAGQELSNLTEVDKGSVVLYAQWNPKQMSVRVPAAIHFTADSDGVMTGPDDGVARVKNQGEVSVRVRNTHTELYDPSEVEVGFSLEDKVLCPGDSLGMSDLRGHTNNPLPEEREVGCIHWKFEAV